MKELEISFYSSDIDFIKFIFFFDVLKLPLFSSTYVENASISVLPSIFLQEFDSSTMMFNCIPNPLLEASKDPFDSNYDPFVSISETSLIVLSVLFSEDPSSLLLLRMLILDSSIFSNLICEDIFLVKSIGSLFGELNSFLSFSLSSSKVFYSSLISGELELLLLSFMILL